ncbi:MAG TPA: DUF2505 family protein [Acidimicrobiales bacterium]|nr:DUF2505 family protein [Acidimicrobiales bacterium]
MHFRTEHRFRGPPDEVARVLADPAFHLSLRLPDLSLPDLLDQRADGQSTTLVLRYEFTGSLDPLARRLLGSHRLTWVQELAVRTMPAAGTIRYHAEQGPERLRGAATFTLEPAPAGGSVRRLEGTLAVGVPLVGGMAERRIVGGLLRRLDLEAAAVDERLAHR